MNMQEFAVEVKNIEVNKHAKRKITNLADSLALLGRIPEGSQLVAIIGKGSERSNIEALRTWVGKELKQCGLCEENELDYLYARLLMILGEYGV